MLIFKTIQDIQNQIFALKKEGKKIGFAPTMGALHEGHVSLIRQSRRENDITVCSIFVNPTQFNDPNDFEKYPSTLESDMQKLITAKCDILFLPSVAEMYPTGLKNPKPLDFGFLAETLEGEWRPGHFAGMAQIVEKLLRAVTPDRLYMGQKDYQQAMICSDMIRQLKLKTRLVLCPVKREKDGLAMSSRNVRLDKKSRAKAVEISKVLRSVKASIKRRRTTDDGPQKTPVIDYEKKAFDRLSSFSEFKVEYVAIRNAKTLKPVKNISTTTPLVALVAAWIGGVRLIDNMLL
ncbi:MAG: pantoate--beta-alanine ligase [Bacteroidetes bacterium]|nr:pantoate--beta-alanine ligase [Bacteroidota bacterium]